MNKLGSPQERATRPWLQRYLAGERVAVWEELEALGPILEPAIREEAKRVGDETMRRVAEVIGELGVRLVSVGYPLRRQPAEDPEVGARIARLTVVAGGPVPISIAAFWRVVGAIDFAPIQDADLPDWMPTDVRWLVKIDPLVVDRLHDAWYSVREWQDELDAAPAEVGSLELTIAPDRFHKVNVSGGPALASLRRAWSCRSLEGGGRRPRFD